MLDEEATRAGLILAELSSVVFSARRLGLGYSSLPGTKVMYLVWVCDHVDAGIQGTADPPFPIGCPVLL